MQKFSEFVKEHKTILESKAQEAKETKFTSLFESKLKEMGAKTILDLNEEDLEKFNSYVKSLKEDLSKGDVKKMVKDEAGNGSRIAIFASGAVAALALTFSDSFWFSAVEAEVYAMSSFFTALTFWAALRWEESNSKYADQQRAQ